MKRLTLDLVLASVLAVAPLASAQQDVPGALQPRSDTTPAGPRPTPSTTRQNTPPAPTDQAPQRVPLDVPPAGTPPPSSTTGSERAGNEPVDSPPPVAGRPEPADRDLELVREVQDLNEKELKIARLAADKARSPRVKSYARALIRDHKAASRQLTSYVVKRGLSGRLQQVAAETPSQEPDMHARLMGETGREFDQDFVATMVDDHDRAIQAVRAARDAAVDPQLRDMFDLMLPKLEKHRKMAQQLLEKHLKS